MAESFDSYKDLEELGINDSDDDFSKAANHVQSLAASADTKTLLTLYGYYKQATEGPCNTPKPSWYDMKAKSKWEAWNSLGDLSRDKAKDLYIETVKKLDSSFEVEKTSDFASNNTSWVCVSTMQPDSEDDELNPTEKSLIDYIKDSDIKNVLKQLESLSADNLNELDDGLSALHWASDRGAADVVDALLSHGSDVNLKDSDGQTPLHYAVSCAHIECIKVLLKHGADVNLKDDSGDDVLSLAQDDSVRNLLSSL